MMPKCRAEIDALNELNALEKELRLAQLDTAALVNEAEPSTLAAIASVDAMILVERAKPTRSGAPRAARPAKPAKE
jgi:hypothetical protein